MCISIRSLMIVAIRVEDFCAHERLCEIVSHQVCKSRGLTYRMDCHRKLKRHTEKEKDCLQK